VLLIERFASANNAIVPRSIAFVLSQRASAPTALSVAWVYDFIRQLKRRDDASTLINCLTTIQRQTIYDRPWPQSDEIPPVLAPFLLHCLTQSAPVQLGALDLLAHLDRDQHLLERISRDYSDAIKSKLSELAAQPDWRSRTNEINQLLRRSSIARAYEEKK